MSSKKVIIAACEKGDLPQLKHVLEETELDVGSEPLGSEGETALHVACAHGHLDIVQYLVNDRGCSVAVPNSRAVGATPLEVAWANEHWEVVEFLLSTIEKDLPLAEVGSQLNVSFLINNVLNQSCEHGYSKIVEVLTETSALRIARLHWHDGLLTACCYGQLDIALYLMKKRGCDPTLVGSAGVSPLQQAWNNKHWRVASHLVKAIQKSGSHCALSLSHTATTQFLEIALFGEDALHAACSRGLLEAVHFLHEYLKCSLEQPSPQGETPLTIARSNGYLHIVQFLLKNVTCAESDLREMHVACIVGDEERVRVLSSNRACLRATDNYGMTPVHYASCEPATLKILVSVIEQNDIKLQDKKGNTPLHYTAMTGCVEAMKIIFMNYECNPNATNIEGCTPLHVAVRRREFQSAATLLKHPKCNPNFQDLSGSTPLHMALSSNISLPNIWPLLNHKDIDLSIQNGEGNTPLHEAVKRKVPVDVMEALTLHNSCNPSIANNVGMTPLQISVLHNRCNPSISNAEGMTPMQIVVDSQQMETATILITSKKCSREDIVRASKNESLLIHSVFSDDGELLTTLIDAGVDINILISKSNSKGETALHAVCKKGNIKATQLLLQGGADVLAVDCQGNAPIHVACANMALECLSLILHHKRCNPNQQNAVGDTPLHILCSHGWNCDMRMLHTLLSTPGINPESANHAGQIPAELAKSNYNVIKMISKYLEHKNAKLETYLKLFVVGNSGGGKSTLIKAVTTERSKFSFKAKHVNPSEVPPHTAGIVPLSFNSKHFGHAVLYDFAGQHEYYSSHAAVMENLVLPSPPLFLLLIDISKPMDEIREELVYWWMFINNHSKRATAPPHVILVGSHKDVVKERGGNTQKIIEEITDIVRDIPVSFQFDHSKAFPLDCRKLVSRGLTALLAQLKLTCRDLRQTADIDLHCHILKAFLISKFQSSIACEVPEIAEKMKSEDVLLPREPSQLISLLSTLSDKGYILLLQNHTDVNKSWVVLKPEALLAEVNGSIFAPDNFKEYCSGFAMSTGVVPLSKIIEKFGELNNQVIIRYLTHLEFCFRIKDQHTLEMITKDATLQLMTQGSECSEEYYFFPALIQNENPSDVCQPQETIKYECGWFYRCNEPTEQLATRFLHVLILRLAFSCDPPDEPTERESVVLLRSCSVWKHGIAWWTNDGIETIVEVGLQCRWVAVMLRCPDTHKVQCAELRTKVISTALKTKQDFCPAINMKEFLIAPSSLQYPFEGRELTLYSMKEIAKVIITGKEFPIDTEGKSTIHISQLLPFEPFFNFGEDLIDNLYTPDQSRESEISRHNMFQIANKCYKMLDDFKEALQPNPTAFQRECVKPDCTEVDRCVSLFQIIQRRGCKTWRDFEQEFSRYSIFCGRHPMVSLML